MSTLVMADNSRTYFRHRSHVGALVAADNMALDRTNIGLSADLRYLSDLTNDVRAALSFSMYNSNRFHHRYQSNMVMAAVVDYLFYNGDCMVDSYLIVWFVMWPSSLDWAVD